MEALTTITPLDIIVSILIGIPFGLLFPVRPKYMFIDLAAGAVFFISLSLTRFTENTFTGELLEAGLLYGIFLISSIVSTRFNKTAQAKEEIIKTIEKQNKE